MGTPKINIQKDGISFIREHHGPGFPKKRPSSPVLVKTLPLSRYHPGHEEEAPRLEGAPGNTRL